MYCKTCGKLLVDEANFCPKCGELVREHLEICPYCDKELTKDSEFCTNCGEKLYYDERISYNKVARKSRIAAGLFALFLGCWGVYEFYLGYTFRGIIHIALTILCLITAENGGAAFGLAVLIWSIIDGIAILSRKKQYDAYGNPIV